MTNADGSNTKAGPAGALAVDELEDFAGSSVFSSFFELSSVTTS
jgi:hypothetical protein